MFSENQQIGNYTLIKRIGRGGFGEVWLAERRTALLTTLAAVKLPHDGQINLEAIRHEAGLWAKASGHPNVLPIIEANIYDGQVVIVSEFAPDGSLEEKLQQTVEIPVKRTVEMIIGILNGLSFLHSRQIIHRDIKPANILLQDDTPRLADFGISRVINTTALSTAIVGTPKYMAPEAFDGKRSVQTDIWSVGIVLYQMLCGNVPFRQENPTEIMWAIVTKEPEPLPESVPPGLREIVRKSLAKLPENRYKTALEMREELQRSLINISHPTFAPTEVFEKTLQAVKDDAQTIEDKSVVTNIHLPLTTNFVDKTINQPKPESDIPTEYNRIPPTVPSVNPSSVENQLPVVTKILETTNKWANNPVIRGLLCLFTAVFGIISVVFVELIIADVIGLRFFFSSVSMTYLTVSGLLISIDIIIFGVFGAVLGFFFPKEKWKWGLWLNFFTIFYFVFQVNKIGSGKIGLGTWVLFLFILTVAIPCLTSYLGSRLSPLKFETDLTKTPAESTTARILRWVFYFLAPIIGMLTNALVNEIVYEFFTLIKVYSMPVYYLKILVSIVFIFIVFGIIGICLGYSLPREKWRWGLWLNIITSILVFNSFGSIVSTSYGVNWKYMASLEIIKFSFMVGVPCLTSYLGSRLASRKSPEKVNVD